MTMIRLESIAFNHDSATATHDAINMRKNATDWIAVPEWRRGVSLLPEDSTAAYAVKKISPYAEAVASKISADATIEDWARALRKEMG